MNEFTGLLDTIRILRSPRGCPWDRAQTVETMKQYLLEEVYELIDAIESGKPESVREELGDIILILIVLSEMFKEKKQFDIKAVLEGIRAKLVNRHPHVFSTKKLKTKEAVLSYWIKTKAKAKKRKSIEHRLPRSAPALLLAELLYKEQSYIGRPARAQNTANDFFTPLAKKITRLKGQPTPTQALIDILLDISKYAYSRRIDLEGKLKAAVFRRARAVSYSGRAK